MGFLTWSIIHLFLLLQLQTPVVLSQNIINGSVLVGESLTASESQKFSSSWRSPSGDFALGFRKIRPNDGFTLSIWFDKIPDKTIVWHAQAVNTTTGFVPAGSKVTLTSDGGLVLTSPRGQLHWSSSLPPSSSSVSRGLITDAGEFGLFSQDSTVALWSSFDHPTDTLLPTQNIISGSVPVGESLTASESQQFSSSWLSPSGDFAFGFRKIQPNDGFTLSIWFDKIPDKTIVWYAQTVNTTTGLVPDGSKVTLTADRGLVLTDPGGQQLWSSSLPQTRSSVSRGLITDAGNLRLLSEDSDVALWSSFANPTDTLLPTQSIEVRGNLSSRLKETSFQKGRFRLRFDDGDLQLLTLNSETLAETDVYFSYYSSNTKDPHNPGNRLVFNETGYMYVVMRDNTTRFYVNNKDPVPSKDFYHRAVLHFDGVFAQYYHPKRQGVNNSDNGWSLAWSEPENICAKTFGPYLDANELGNLACGFNNICILGYNHRPRCECPERFLLVDPSDEYGDCKPDFEMQTCERESDQTAAADQDANLYEFVTLRMTNWPSGDYKRYSNYDEERCKATCLKDCFCGAVVLGRDRLCWKKKFPLSYGIRDTNGDSDTFIKVLKLGSRS